MCILYICGSLIKCSFHSNALFFINLNQMNCFLNMYIYKVLHLSRGSFGWNRFSEILACRWRQLTFDSPLYMTAKNEASCVIRCSTNAISTCPQDIDGDQRPKFCSAIVMLTTVKYSRRSITITRKHFYIKGHGIWSIWP